MAIDKYHHPQAADLHEPMLKKHPEHQMAKSCLQRRTLEQDKTSHTGDGNKEKEMWMDRSYTTQAHVGRQLETVLQCVLATSNM